MKRRDFLSLAASLPIANIAWNARAFAEEDMPKPSRNRFLLYIHLGSNCGISSGLVQPIAPGKWPKGFFHLGQDGESINSLVNQHTMADNGMVLHDYNKFLAPITGDMCLVNGDAQSLDHNVANIIQKRGVPITAAAPEWPMAITQFMKTPAHPNPMVISSGVKTASVPDVTTVQATDIADFQRITQDITSIPKASSPFTDILKKRFNNPKLGSVLPDSNLNDLATYQLSTLVAGLKELNDAKADIKAIQDALSKDSIADLVKDCKEHDQISRNATDTLRNSFQLAAILAKTGLANGFHLSVGGGDNHQGANDVNSPRETAGVWALVAQFWKWAKANNLQEDIMIVMSHDFSRTAYNGKIIEMDVIDKDGKNQHIKSEGRDHALAMGMMFINANVPKGGRIGFITENMVPVATKDAKGTIDSAGTAYISSNMVGSMFMRVYPELFPTERMVRKHWPTFKQIDPILA